jgi:hypothetical protein
MLLVVVVVVGFVFVGWSSFEMIEDVGVRVGVGVMWVGAVVNYAGTVLSRKVKDTGGSKIQKVKEEDKKVKERWCVECLGVKSGRMHHCSACGECVRRMDHHCESLSYCDCLNCLILCLNCDSYSCDSDDLRLSYLSSLICDSFTMTDLRLFLLVCLVLTLMTVTVCLLS